MEKKLLKVAPFIYILCHLHVCHVKYILHLCVYHICELLKVAPFIQSSYKRIKWIIYETSKQHVCDVWGIHVSYMNEYHYIYVLYPFHTNLLWLLYLLRVSYIVLINAEIIYISHYTNFIWLLYVLFFFFFFFL